MSINFRQIIFLLIASAIGIYLVVYLSKTDVKGVKTADAPQGNKTVTDGPFEQKADLNTVSIAGMPNYDFVNH